LSRGIAVLDFGGQYAHLITNRIRRLHVYARTLPPDAPASAFAEADGIILSGGPASVYDEDSPPFNAAVLESGKPILGLCYGHQLLCHSLGGTVELGETMEYGAAHLNVGSPTGVLQGLSRKERIWMSHRDTVTGLPPGFQALASTDDCPIAVMADDKRKIFGMQFHPEVTHTESGMKILENFVDLCGSERDWTMENFIRDSMQQLEEKIGDRKVFLLVSGGVDSTVCFLLLNKALGTERVQGLHIDNGFMRLGETALVERLLRDSGFTNLEVVDASADFLKAVEGIADPEEKRVRIGTEFIEVRDRVLDQLGMDPQEWLLGQGTLYTDTIESGGTDHAQVIKTHHNRVGVIEQLLAEGKVIEPLDQLYKDEVRELGEALGLPHHLVWRHPFPGPGLAVRALCVNGEALDSVPAEAEAVAGEIAGRFDLDAHILPLRSVGVQGDGRTYAHPAVLTGKSTDGGAFIPQQGGIEWSSLEILSTELTNAVSQINRVILQLGPARRLRQRLKAAYLTRPRLDLLRQADDLVMTALQNHNLMEQVTQMPTVLLPLSSDGVEESVVLRPITTDDFMTARFDQLPVSYLEEVTAGLLALNGIEAVYYDVTNKPPGTVEWE
jgi:GMP synthase (glutamine-hydrolysing)